MATSRHGEIRPKISGIATKNSSRTSRVWSINPRTPLSSTLPAQSSGLCARMMTLPGSRDLGLLIHTLPRTRVRGSSRARKQLSLTTGKTSRWIEVSSAQTECAIIILNLVGIFDRYPWPKRYFTSAARSGVGISDRHPPSRHADYLL